jgi:hypothetical protein
MVVVVVSREEGEGEEMAIDVMRLQGGGVERAVLQLFPRVFSNDINQNSISTFLSTACCWRLASNLFIAKQTRRRSDEHKGGKMKRKTTLSALSLTSTATPNASTSPYFSTTTPSTTGSVPAIYLFILKLIYIYIYIYKFSY